MLYATDFLNNDLETINGSFSTVKTLSCAGLGVSSDPYSWVWSVQAVNDKLYVAFADLFNPAGGGGGAVDVFSAHGKFEYQLDANGPGSGRLQNPWGIAQAPPNFGALSNDLLVGNVAGDGNINVYNPKSGKYLGQMLQPDGDAIAIKGLWDLEFGDGTPRGGKTNQLFFDAGPNHPGDAGGGLFGVIQSAGHKHSHHRGGYQFGALVIDIFGSSGSRRGGLLAQPSTRMTPARGGASTSGAASTVTTPADKAPGLPALGVRHQEFADREDMQSLAFAPTADPLSNW